MLMNSVYSHVYLEIRLTINAFKVIKMFSFYASLDLRPLKALLFFLEFSTSIS